MKKRVKKRAPAVEAEAAPAVEVIDAPAPQARRPHPAKGKTQIHPKPMRDPRKLVDDAEAQKRIFALWRRGHTFNEIAESLGVGRAYVIGLHGRAYQDYFDDHRVVLQRDVAKIRSRLDLIAQSYELEAIGGVRVDAQGNRTEVKRSPEAARIYLSAVRQHIALVRPEQHLHVELPNAATAVETAQVDAMSAARLVRGYFPAVSEERGPRRPEVETPTVEIVNVEESAPAANEHHAEPRTRIPGTVL